MAFSANPSNRQSEVAVAPAKIRPEQPSWRQITGLDAPPSHPWTSALRDAFWVSLGMFVIFWGTKGVLGTAVEVSHPSPFQTMKIGYDRP